MSYPTFPEMVKLSNIQLDSRQRACVSGVSTCNNFDNDRCQYAEKFDADLSSIDIQKLCHGFREDTRMDWDAQSHRDGGYICCRPWRWKEGGGPPLLRFYKSSVQAKNLEGRHAFPTFPCRQKELQCLDVSQSRCGSRIWRCLAQNQLPRGSGPTALVSRPRI